LRVIGAVLSSSTRAGTSVYSSTESDTSRVVFVLYSLKLGNIMLNDNMEVKIGDFGLAAKL
jgi:hypothetical protein